MNIDRLIGHYVIIYYHKNKIKFLADPDMEDRVWTYNMEHAKCYYDLSAAEVKAGNLRYGMHAVDAQVKYVNRDGRLYNIRRNRNGRR